VQEYPSVQQTVDFDFGTGIPDGSPFFGRLGFGAFAVGDEDVVDGFDE
jgi:hypothetical protein